MVRVFKRLPLPKLAIIANLENHINRLFLFKNQLFDLILPEPGNVTLM